MMHALLLVRALRALRCALSELVNDWQEIWYAPLFSLVGVGKEGPILADTESVRTLFVIMVLVFKNYRSTFQFILRTCCPTKLLLLLYVISRMIIILCSTCT